MEAFEQAKTRRLVGERDSVVKTRFDTAEAVSLKDMRSNCLLYQDFSATMRNLKLFFFLTQQALLELETEEKKLEESLRLKEKWRDSMKAVKGVRR